MAVFLEKDAKPGNSFWFLFLKKKSFKKPANKKIYAYIKMPNIYIYLNNHHVCLNLSPFKKMASASG